MRRLRALAVVHPFPSVLNALLVLGLALLAGGRPDVAARLGLAMLLLQFCIGASNDLWDEQLDARSKPSKPIPAGLIDRHAVYVLALATASGALLLAASVGLASLILALGMLSAGLAYNAFLKRGSWGWLAYAVAFPLLPLYAWHGASGDPPPRYEQLLPLAALAGPALQLTNGVVDVGRDRAAGIVTLAGRLGRRRAVGLIGLILLVIYGGAWLSLLRTGDAPAAALLLAAGASAFAAFGWRLSAAGVSTVRERGWRLQATALALLAFGWLVAALSAVSAGA